MRKEKIIFDEKVNDLIKTSNDIDNTRWLCIMKILILIHDKLVCHKYEKVYKLAINNIYESLHD